VTPTPSVGSADSQWCGGLCHKPLRQLVDWASCVCQAVALVVLGERWADFFRDRGLDARSLTANRLTGGEVNDNWRVSRSDGAEWVLRHYQRTVDADELACELAAVDKLARSGFPTPAPVPATGKDGERRLWDVMDGRPAALFTFVRGRHPVQRPGGYGSMDLRAGERAARAAAQMHISLMHTELPGSRSPERDPWRQIGAFLDGDLPADPLFADLRDPLRQVHARLMPIYQEPGAVPAGLIHNDITPLNILLGDQDEIVALLDFDDCAQTFLAYDLGAIISTFGKDEERQLDRGRVSRLIAAYESVRLFTPTERAVLPDLLTAHAGAQAVQVITHWIRSGRTNISATDSYSALDFLELSERPLSP